MKELFKGTIDFLDLEFHHFGLAVKYPDQMRTYLQLLGYKSQKAIINKFNVYIQFHDHESMPRIELIYKYKDSTPIDNILKSNDSLIYHTCYRCNNINRVLQILKENGFKIFCVSKPTEDFPFSFYYIKEIGLIELFEDISYFQ